MMVTNLPAGTVVVFRSGGGLALWRVIEHPTNPARLAYSTVNEHLQPGTVIHRCVWKKDRLESRQTYILKPGDAEWIPVGPAMFSTGRRVYRNVFVGGMVPRWLREAR
jgi:hypothetical protein